MSEDQRQEQTSHQPVHTTGMYPNDPRIKLAYLKREYKKLRAECLRLQRVCFTQQEQTVQQEHYIHQLESLNQNQRRTIKHLSQQVALEKELSEDALLMLHDGQNLLRPRETPMDTAEEGVERGSEALTEGVTRVEGDGSFAESQFLEQQRRRYATDQVFMKLYKDK